MKHAGEASGQREREPETRMRKLLGREKEPETQSRSRWAERESLEQRRRKPLGREPEAAQKPLPAPVTLCVVSTHRLVPDTTAGFQPPFLLAAGEALPPLPCCTGIRGVHVTSLVWAASVHPTMSRAGASALSSVSLGI